MPSGFEFGDRLPLGRAVRWRAGEHFPPGIGNEKHAKGPRKVQELAHRWRKAENTQRELEFKEAATLQEKYWPGRTQNPIMRK
jgi:hypothetical protein